MVPSESDIVVDLGLVTAALLLVALLDVVCLVASCLIVALDYCTFAAWLLNEVVE